MTIKIRKTDDPILRQPTEKVVDFGFETQALIDQMIETMRKANGIGLAAPQVGSATKMIVCEFEGEADSKIPSFPLTVLCNPEIIHYSKNEHNMVEGCLSFPGLEILIKRPSEIKVTGQDRYGKNVTITADKLFGRVLQHEIDHLNSTLLIDHIQETDIIFVGTGTLGAPALEMLALDPQYNVKLVITGNSQATSRNHNELTNIIEDTAKKYKLPILKTDNINNPEVVKKINELKPEVGILADFGQMISDDILNIPRLGMINIHPSLLPRHRGPSPLQQTILDGDKLAGVSLILTGSKMDAGALISQLSVRLSGSETTTILKDYLARAGATQLLNALPYYIAGDLVPEPQDDKKATYNKLFKKEDGFVDENTPAKIVERKIRAFDAWPKVYTIVKGKRVQLLAAHYDEEKQLVIDRVKPEGKQEMSYDDFVRGYHVTLTFKG